MKTLILIACMCQSGLNRYQFPEDPSPPKAETAAVADPAPVKQSPPLAADARSQTTHLVVFGFDACTFCHIYHDRQLPEIRRHYRVAEINTDKHPEWRTEKLIKWVGGPKLHSVTRCPAVWLVESATGTVLHEWIGGPTLEQIRLIEKRVLTVESAPPPSNHTTTATRNVRSIYNGQRGSSHQSRSTLISHLLNDGIHRGKHSRDQLDAMTDDQLDALHDKDHDWD